MFQLTGSNAMSNYGALFVPSMSATLEDVPFNGDTSAHDSPTMAFEHTNLQTLVLTRYHDGFCLYKNALQSFVSYCSFGVTSVEFGLILSN